MYNLYPHSGTVDTCALQIILNDGYSTMFSNSPIMASDFDICVLDLQIVNNQTSPYDIYEPLLRKNPTQDDCQHII